MGDSLETMNDNTRREEKIVLNDTVMPERWSPFYNLTTEDSYNLWIKIIRAAERYADLNFTDDTWLTVAEHNNFDHNNLGIGLRIVNMNIHWSNASNEYRNNEWNNFIIKATNTFTLSLWQLATNKRKRSIKAFMEVVDCGMMYDAIKMTLDKLFDTVVPDAQTYDSIDAQLTKQCRDNLTSSMAHACFTVGDAVVGCTNACWLKRTEYDTHLSHFFRAVLYHFLAVAKVIVGVQQYRVRYNLDLNSMHSLSNVEFRIVQFDFSIIRLGEHEDSSDEEMKDEREEEEEEEEEEVVNYEGNDDSTFTITHTDYHTIDMDRPAGFSRITQVVGNDRVLTEDEQMEELVTILIPLLPLDRLVRVAERVQQEREQRVQLLANQVGLNTNFFGPTGSFSSGSEGEEEM